MAGFRLWMKVLVGLSLLLLLGSFLSLNTIKGFYMAADVEPLLIISSDLSISELKNVKAANIEMEEEVKRLREELERTKSQLKESHTSQEQVSEEQEYMKQKTRSERDHLHAMAVDPGINSNIDNNSRDDEENKDDHDDDDEIVYNNNNVCTLLHQKYSNSNNNKNNNKQYMPSTQSLWNDHLQQIFEHSRHVQDKKEEYIWHDYTAILLHYMTSYRLQTSVKSLPTNYWDRVEDILSITYQRWNYVQSLSKDKKDGSGNSEQEPRKLNILVLGGSVTMGVNCRVNPVFDTSRFARRNCAWPLRLQTFLNNVLGNGSTKDNVVDVHTVTLGGTNTESAITIWDYSIFPQGTPYPDIVIHAYSTNDMHVLFEKGAKDQNTTLEERILLLNQQFIRSVLEPNMNMDATQTSSSPENDKDDNDDDSSCIHKPPLLLYFDDYIGNEQKEILQTMAFSKAINILSQYYQFGYMSYADAVRDIIYRNTATEMFFSPDGWPERNVHPTMGMHISSTWIISFYFLNLVTTFCSQSSREVNNFRTSIFGTGGTGDGPGEEKEERYDAIHGFPELRKATLESLKGAPDPKRPLSLKPEINNDLTLDVISHLWSSTTTTASNAGSYNDGKDDASIKERIPTTTTNTNTNTYCPINKIQMPTPCEFHWVGALEKDFSKTKHLDARMKDYILDNQGWESVDDGGKLGYAAIQPNSTFSMKFGPVVRPIQTLNFMFMKSYGDKWDNSRIHVEVFTLDDSVKKKRISDSNMIGFHPKKTSEIYNHKIPLRWDGVEDDDDDWGIKIGESFQIDFRLVAGLHFKFTGMAFCNKP